MIDTALIEQAKVDPKKLNELLSQCEALFYEQPLLRWLDDQDDRDEVVQQSLIRVWKHIGAYTASDALPFEAWLFRIFRNQFLTCSTLKRTRNNTFMSYDLLLEEGSIEEPIDEITPERIFESKEYLDYVIDSLYPELLTENEFICLWMCGLQGVSIAETAETLKRSENNVKQFLHSARKKIREKYKPGKDDPLDEGENVPYETGAQ